MIEKAQTIEELRKIKEEINKFCMLEIPGFYLSYHKISNKWHKKNFKLREKKEQTKEAGYITKLIGYNLNYIYIRYCFIIWILFKLYPASLQQIRI